MAKLWQFWLHNRRADYFGIPVILLGLDYAVGGPFYVQVLLNGLLK